MHTVAPDGIKWYWIVYDIPLQVHSLAENTQGVGTTAGNSVNSRLSYAPPCSQGPGAKSYTLTLYALSATPRLTIPPVQVTRDLLLVVTLRR